MVYAGIVDITPSPFKHFQGCHELTQVYSGRMGVAPHWEDAAGRRDFLVVIVHRVRVR